MRCISKLLVMATILGTVGVASAAGKPKSAAKPSIDDLFAAASKKPSAKPAPVAKAKPVAQPRAAVVAKAPKRASKAMAAPIPTPAPQGGGESAQMVLADSRPERHALAGP
jgi:hypothetical protein